MLYVYCCNCSANRKFKKNTSAIRGSYKLNRYRVVGVDLDKCCNWCGFYATVRPRDVVGLSFDNFLNFGVTTTREDRKNLFTPDFISIEESILG